MLDIAKVQSTNNVNIIGILKELDIEEKTTADGRAYVQGKAIIGVDQEVGGKVVENEIPIRMFSMQKKSDGNPNSIYTSILRMKEEFISLSAADEPSQASVVSISGGSIRENVWFDKSGIEHLSYNVETNFMKEVKDKSTEQSAKFELTGVIGNISDEVDNNGDSTGRLKVKLITVGYAGRVEVIELIAQNPVAVNHIQTNYEKGDTVNLAGIINMTYKVVTWEEEQGFGEPIKRTRTESRRELLITSGSQSGLEEELSYDGDAIKLALEERKQRNEKRKEATSAKKPAAPAKPATNFGF